MNHNLENRIEESFPCIVRFSFVRHHTLDNTPDYVLAEAIIPHIECYSCSQYKTCPRTPEKILELVEMERVIADTPDIKLHIRGLYDG